jgi:hypothetical protein
MAYCMLQYYEEIGKPTPKVEVMKYLKGKQYVDAKDFAGECEAVVVVAKGQGMNDRHPALCTVRNNLGQFQFSYFAEYSNFILFVQSPHMLLITDALSTHSRCAGDMQVWHEGGLHTGIAKLALQVRAWILHGHLFQRDVGSPHR